MVGSAIAKKLQDDSVQLITKTHSELDLINQKGNYSGYDLLGCSDFCTLFLMKKGEKPTFLCCLANFYSPNALQSRKQ